MGASNPATWVMSSSRCIHGPVLQAFQGLVLTTAKLHHSVLHVIDQLACQGPGSLYTEYWIERMIWYLKLYLKDRVRDSGEIIFVNDHVLVKSAQSCRCEFPTHCMTIAERRAKPKVFEYPTYDMVGDNVLLLGPAVRAGLTDEQTSCVVQQLPRLLRVGGDSAEWYRKRGWPAIDDDVMLAMHAAERFQFDKYLQASLPSMDVVTCDEDRRHVASDNRWVYVGYRFDDDSESACVALVQCFVRIRTSNGASAAFDPRGCVPVHEVQKYIVPADVAGKSTPAEPLRMAICKLWAATVRDRPEEIGSPIRTVGTVPDILYVPNMGEGEETMLPYSARGSRGDRCYYGEVLVNLPEVWSQLVASEPFPVEKANGGYRESRYFMSSWKLSGK